MPFRAADEAAFAPDSRPASADGGVTRVGFVQGTKEYFGRILPHLIALDAEDVEERIGHLARLECSTTVLH